MIDLQKPSNMIVHDWCFWAVMLPMVHDPKHTSESTQKWFCENTTNIFHWPSQWKTNGKMFKIPQMCSPNLSNIRKGPVLLSLPDETAPSNHISAINCETWNGDIFLFIMVGSFELPMTILQTWKLQFVSLLVLFVFYCIFVHFYQVCW